MGEVRRKFNRGFRERAVRLVRDTGEPIVQARMRSARTHSGCSSSGLTALAGTASGQNLRSDALMGKENRDRTKIS
jgi:hypothetical protein